MCMAERGGRGSETVKKVEIGGAAVGIIGLLFEAPALAVVGLLAVSGAEAYKYYQRSKK